MTQPGYNAGNEPMWWWKVALHLDEAQLALANAMAHNVDDPRPVQALYDRFREGQVILLEILRAKGLLPGSIRGTAEAPVPPPPMPGMHGMPPGVPPGVPMPPMHGMPMPFAPVDGDVAAPSAAEAQSLAVEEPAVPEADHAAAAAEPAAVLTSEVVTPPAVIVVETQADVPPAPPGAEGARG